MDFRMLGSLEVEANGMPIDLGPPKQRAVLAVLLLNINEVVPTDRLIDFVWGEDPPRTAGHSVQIYVSELRKAFQNSGGAASIVTRPPGYVLETSSESVDVCRFGRLIEEGSALVESRDPESAVTRLQSAIDLWRGPPLTDFAFDEFAQPHIRRLNELRLIAEEGLAAAEMELGRNWLAVASLERIVAEGPLRERARGLYMLALYRQGRQAEALRAYRDFRSLLGSELGIEPSPPLQRLEELILQQDPSLDLEKSPEAGRTGNLPAEVTSFVGRETELQQIQRLLGSSRLVTLLGIGGVGKSRLAVRAARSLADAFRDGTWLAELSGVSDPDHVASEVASIWGLTPKQDESARALCSLLEDHQTLLVLDNCEAVVEGVSVLAERLLLAAPELRILATSRQPLEIQGEVLCRIAPLDLPAEPLTELSVDDLAAFSAVRLFEDRAGMVVPGFQFDPQSAVGAARICGLLDGIPLAIELAAARARNMTLAEIEEGLDDRFALLVGGGRATPTRHRALEATINWSYELLDSQERELFARLGVFRHRFPLTGAEVICGGEGIDDADVHDLLGRLVDKSLLIREERNGRTWYAILESLRRYAYEKIALSGRARFDSRGFVLALAQRTDVRLRGRENRMWSVLLEGERQVIRTVLEAAYSSWAEDQGSFLAGVAAASVTRTGRVGFLGGLDPRGSRLAAGPHLAALDVITRFRNGFLSGVRHVASGIEIDEAFLTEEDDFVHAFEDRSRGREAAGELYSRGCDVVMHAAGLSGSGIFEAARRMSRDTETHCWGIGVDFDEYLVQPDSLRQHVLTSVVKQVPIDVFLDLKTTVVNGNPEEAPRFDLSNEGIRLSTSGGHLDSISANLEELRDQIISGDVSVSEGTALGRPRCATKRCI